MAYLLRTADDYRIFYSKPVYGYVISRNKTFYTVEDYKKMMRDEKNEEYLWALEENYIVMDGWADISESDHGILISDDVADYMLEGRDLEVNKFAEISINI